ncbi:hypothetical protein BaRGS_00014811 [Batillaria attramentaria]|uniref:FMRFamide-activated amiloride-sensitive sodium channel n=1 Tax=Batillaria attramentaria TaxID=370345 RepID=A0ABD0L489_9CAEN
MAVVADNHQRQGYVSILHSSADTFSDPVAGVHDRGIHGDHLHYSGMSKFGTYPEHRIAHQRRTIYHPQRRYYHRKNAITLITELGSESNAHGLAKIVTSSDTKRKVIWALMVIIGFTAATLQLSLLVRKYLEFQVVELSEIKDSMPVEFPSVTVCNIEPISWRKLRVLFENPDLELLQWLNFTASGEQQKKLLMHATGPQNGLSLIISLDNDEPPLGSYGVYNIDSNILHSAGVRVVVHAPNTMPSPVNHGFDIPPGYSSSIGLKAVLHTRLPEPYGNCTRDSLAGMNYTNTFFSCLQVCKQRIIIDKCKCKSSALPEVAPEVTFCGVISNWKDILAGLAGYKKLDEVPIPSLACEERVLQELANDRSYELFYGTEIKQNFMHEAFTFLSELANLSQLMLKRNDSRTENLLKQSMTLSEKEKAERASNLIRQNLLRLNIYLEDLSVVEYRQLPAYGLADLFADIGGTLGLWMGISVLTIMELIELVIRLFFLLSNAENHLPSMDDDAYAENGMLGNHEKEFMDATEYEYRNGTETTA